MGQGQVTVGLSASAPVSATSDALAVRGLRAVVLTPRELTNLTSGVSASAVLGVLALHAATALMDTADTTAALTCEAIQAHTYPFDVKHFDAKAQETGARSLKGVMASAAQLRALLEGSRSANESKRVAQDDVAVRSIPQQHGPAREVIEVQ
jgi:histidine ammonia-lyase